MRDETDPLTLLVERFNEERRCAVEAAAAEQALQRAKAEMEAARARYSVAQTDRDQAVMALRALLKESP